MHSDTQFLRRYMVHELKIPQAEHCTDSELMELTVKTMRAMHKAFSTVSDALAVATGTELPVVNKNEFTLRMEAGFKVKDNR